MSPIADDGQWWPIETVEAVAKALLLSDRPHLAPWLSAPAAAQERYRRLALAALQAVPDPPEKP